jgi:hypothetical protein
LAYFNSAYGSAIYLVPRGDAGRLPTQWDANLTLSYPLVVDPATVPLQAFLFNAFNNQIPTNRDNYWTTVKQQGYPDTIYDSNQPISSGNDHY